MQDTREEFLRRLITWYKRCDSLLFDVRQYRRDGLYQFRLPSWNFISVCILLTSIIFKISTLNRKRRTYCVYGSGFNGSFYASPPTTATIHQCEEGLSQFEKLNANVSRRTAPLFCLSSQPRPSFSFQTCLLFLSSLKSSISNSSLVEKISRHVNRPLGPFPEVAFQFNGLATTLIYTLFDGDILKALKSLCGRKEESIPSLTINITPITTCDRSSPQSSHTPWI